MQVLDPGRKGRLDASHIRLDLARERISSAHPFTAVLDHSRLSGTGFEAIGPSHTLMVPLNCRLNHSADSLVANSCSWNWQTNKIEAFGAVELRRKALAQVTRAQRLQGVLTKQGMAVFSNPGARVETRVTLPPRAPSGPDSRKPAPFAL